MSYDIDTLLNQGFEPLRSLEPSPVQIQTALRGAERRRPWPRLRRRNGLVIALAALAIGGGATAALIDRDTQLDEQVRNHGPLPSSGDRALDRLIAAAKTKPSLAPVAKTFSIEVRAADPLGGPEWVLVVWRTKTAGWCSLPAREQGERLGEIAEDGRFRPYPFAEGGSCSARPLGATEAGMVLENRPGVATIVSGVAGRDVAQVEVRVKGLPGVRTLTPSRRGGFMAVLPDLGRHLGFRATKILRDGTRLPSP